MLYFFVFLYDISFAKIIINYSLCKYVYKHYNNVLFLVNQYDEILACAPEELRVGDAENILLVGITLQGVAG